MRIFEYDEERELKLISVIEQIMENLVNEKEILN